MVSKNYKNVMLLACDSFGINEPISILIIFDKNISLLIKDAKGRTALITKFKDHRKISMNCDSTSLKKSSSNWLMSDKAIIGLLLVKSPDFLRFVRYCKSNS